MANCTAIKAVYDEIIQPVDANALSRRGEGYFTTSGGGLAASITPDMKVNMDAWYGAMAWAPTAEPAGYVTLETQHATLDRIDIIYIGASGLAFHKGTAEETYPDASSWKQYEKPQPAAGTLPDGVILGRVLVRSTANGGGTITNDDIYMNTAYGPDNIGLENMASVVVFQRGGETIAATGDGAYIASGATGAANDGDILRAAEAQCPSGGSIFLGPGTYTLDAPDVFYLDGGTSNPFWCCLRILDGKNIHIFGSGVGVTILKLADAQHYVDHPVVMILNRHTDLISNGYTAFTVANLSFDGNYANQTEFSKDGASGILTGSIRSGGKFYNLSFLNMPGYGFYSGNNGSGPETNLLVHNVVAESCYNDGIITDTAKEAVISNCITKGCAIDIYGNSTNYQTRARDNIIVSGCYSNDGLILWCVNDVQVSGFIMDITGQTSYGLLVHSSIGIHISGSKFTANATSQHVTYIDSNTYLADGPTEVDFDSTYLEGYIALKVFGAAVVHYHGGVIKGHWACVYLKEMDEAISCYARLTDVELRPVYSSVYLIYCMALTTTELIRCYSRAPAINSLGGGVYGQDCHGVGLENYKDRWHSLWSCFSGTPANTSTITTTVSLVDRVFIGQPIKYLTSDGGPYYGVVSEVGATWVTIRGPAITGVVYAIWIGSMDLISQVDIVIPGVFNSSTRAVLWNVGKSGFRWALPPAYLVAWSHKTWGLDSTAQPYVTPTKNGNAIDTRNSNAGERVSTNWVDSWADVNTTNYRFQMYDALEIYVTEAGGTKNATYLTMSLIFVQEK